MNRVGYTGGGDVGVGGPFDDGGRVVNTYVDRKLPFWREDVWLERDFPSRGALVLELEFGAGI